MVTRALALLFVAALISGCGETKEVTLYLQDLKVNGTASSPPVHITRDPSPNEIHISPYFSFNTAESFTGRIEGHTPVNARGEFAVDTVVQSDSGVVFRDPGRRNVFEFKGDNVTRKFAQYNLGMDLDFGLSRGVALSVGAHYSSVDGRGLWGYHAGLGFRSQRKNLGLRFDVGWQWEELRYTALTVVTERPISSSASTVTFYEDEGRSNRGRIYLSLVINSVREDWAVNPFLQIALTSQTVQDIQPRTLAFREVFVPPFFIVPASHNIVVDKRGKYFNTFIHIAPGFYVELDEDVRLISGARLMFETEMEERSSTVVVAPFVRFDFRF